MWLSPWDSWEVPLRVPLTAALRMGTIYFLQLLLPFWPPTLGGRWEAGVGVGGLLHPDSILMPPSLQEVFLGKTSNCSRFDKYHPLWPWPRHICMSMAVRNSPKSETTQMPTDYRMDTKIVEYLHSVMCKSHFTAVRINYLKLHTTIWWIS